MKKLLSFVGGAVWLTLITSFAFLNYFSGIIAGIWLVIIGNWGDVGYGILLAIIMPFVYSIVVLPTMLVASLIVYFSEKNNRIMASAATFINNLYSNMIIVLWVFFVFRYFMSEATVGNFIPLLLWGYSTTLGPLGYMASKEPPDSWGTALGMFLAIVSYIVLTTMWLTVGVNFTALIILAVIFSAFALVLVIFMMKENLEN